MGNACCVHHAPDTVRIAADPAAFRQNNSILNRWRCVEVGLLQKRFRSAVGERRSLNQQTLLDLFSFLRTELKPIYHPICFSAFDFDKDGRVDFRDLCRTLALCLHGSRLERLYFLHSLFSNEILSNAIEPSNNGETEGTPITPAVDNSTIFADILEFLKLTVGRPIPNNLNFFDFANDFISDSVLVLTIEKFNLLPHVEEEVATVTHGNSLVVMSNMSVYLLSSDWFKDWISYTNAVVNFDDSGVLVTSVSQCVESDLNKNARRPDEIDNSKLVDNLIGKTELCQGLSGSINGDYIAVNSVVWAALLSLYGGGPVMERILLSDHNNNINLFPFIISIYTINSSTERPELIHSAAMTYSEILIEKLLSDLKINGNNEIEFRIWLLLEDSDIVPFLSLVDEGEEEAPFIQQTNKGQVYFRFGLSSKFVLVPKKFCKLSLIECGLISGCRILVEFSSNANQWSTTRFIEPSDFRKFKNGDTIDAMSLDGSWSKGIIVDVTEVKFGYYRDASSSSSSSSSSPESSMNVKTDTRIKVHFDGQNPKFDEYFDSMSNKVAPRGSHTDDDASPIAQLPTTSQPEAVIEVDATKKIDYQPSIISSATRFIRLVLTGYDKRNDDEDDGAGVSLVKHTSKRRRRRRNRYNSPNDDANDDVVKVVPGIVGLVNLGNTCYMNCALQCLNHTPLLRAYMLSSRYESDLNRDNPLGTQGRLISEFASLLQQLWSDQEEYVNPVRFKRTLDRFKEQFVGHDQHDAQELVAELLDSLHEDVNKVLVKPYTPQPEDDVWDAMTIEEQAQDAWERYLMRNQSVLVDLFQGQIKTEVQCPTCGRISRTFDPFMYLSVPIPTQHDKTIIITLIDRIKSDYFDQLLATSEGKNNEEEVYSEWKTNVTPIRLAVSVARLSEMCVLREEIARTMKHTFLASQVQLVELYRGRIIRFLDDRLTVSCIRNSEHIAALVQVNRPASIENKLNLFDLIYKRITNNEDTKSDDDGKDGEFWGVLNQLEPESNGKEASDETRPPARRLVNWNEYSNYDSDYDDDVTTFVRKKGHKINESNLFSRLNEIKPYEWTRIIKSLFVRYDVPVREEDNCDESDERIANLNRLEELSAESLVERFKITCSEPLTWPPEKQADLIGLRVDALDSKRQWYTGTVAEFTTAKGYRVHFDNYSSRWDEFYPPSSLVSSNRSKAVFQPAFSKAVCTVKESEIQVMLRRNVIVPISSFTLAGTNPNPPTNVLRKELIGLPFMVSVENFRSCKHVKEVIARQALRFLSASACQSILSQAVQNKKRHERHVWVHRVKGLPFQVRVVSAMNILAVHEAEAEFVLQTKKPESEAKPIDDAYLFWEGEEFCDSEFRPFSNYFHPRMAITVDWVDMSAFDEDVCNKFATHETLTSLMETMKSSGNDGLGLGDVTLSDCLASFTREEVVEEWYEYDTHVTDNLRYCSKCKGPKMGRMKCELWRTPDILVIHLKRFNVSGRHREKLFTRIVFPTNSLSVSQYISDCNRKDEGGVNMEHVYDLYSVSNHLGGLSGGHYTAFCRVIPCGVDGVEDVAISSCDSAASSRWVHFDDEFVEDVTQDRLVTEAAYLLFYRRRRLTPANVINMAV